MWLLGLRLLLLLPPHSVVVHGHAIIAPRTGSGFESPWLLLLLHVHVLLLLLTWVIVVALPNLLLCRLLLRRRGLPELHLEVVWRHSCKENNK